MNANDWFANFFGDPRPHAVSNQWAGSIGGPIKKDKLFFFFDTEGLRYVLPGGGLTYVPTADFSSAVWRIWLPTIPARSRSTHNILNLYAGAPGSPANAAPALGES